MSFWTRKGSGKARNYYRGSVMTGLEVEYLEPSDLFDMEPAVSREVRAAIRFPGDASIRPPRLVRALSLAAQRLGTRIVEHSPRSGRGDPVPGGSPPYLTPEDRIQGEKLRPWPREPGSGLLGGPGGGSTCPSFPPRGEIVLLESLPGQAGGRS